MVSVYGSVTSRRASGSLDAVRIASEYVATEPPETQRCENERSTRSVSHSSPVPSSTDRRYS
ncbi:Uncharacterised protein [Mycobacterium tuberculosis]|uniref:Uncharacterized protein n=1 Tax=Mycobacterium tuberculosis TaxID=1773 RepID=A0A916LEL8_MYCTX|nr:Uncharacterised protein [Mycobacterium tuberculosis]COZ81910.1 Uncharacterised protein [Mycobacterium tuberculosis]COZ96347.1 Uncharacterised protein [Mycobacterium tuberculosis]CPA47937.1 Uncharacterised protein [Mycobacterium tuberculosis]